jgi:hypothetical protein
MAGRGSASVALVLVLTLLPACGGSDSASTERPCVVSEEEMASIWGVSSMNASPQENGLECIYSANDELMALLTVRSPEEFEAERARFEDQGLLLPPLEPTGGFEGEATVDPRYNSLNVRSGDVVLSVQIIGTEPADFDDQLELEKRIGRAAVERLN